MKKLISLTLTLVCIFCLSSCSGNVTGVKIIDCDSEIYSDSEIESAIYVTLDYFRKEFDGCNLTEITYIGDENLEGWQEFAERNNADDVIVLVSTFKVGKFGADGSLNPDSTYTGWKWILTRTENGKWEHVDHGY